MFGEGNLDKVIMTGHFQVAFQDMHNSKDGTAVSVWYPMDRDEYDE